MSRFPYGEVLNFMKCPKRLCISGKNKAVLRFMALQLVMDSASPTLLSRAHQGQPLAIATLIHQSLDSDEIDVTAWKKQGLLHVDLMSFERLIKADMLPTIRQTLADTSPIGIRGIKVSSYIYGEESPCWMERMGATADLAPVDTISGGNLGLARPLGDRIEESFRDVVLGRHQRRLATGAIASLALLATVLSISLKTNNSPTPSFAGQLEENQPIKTRSSQSRARKTDTTESSTRAGAKGASSPAEATGLGQTTP